MAPSLPFQNGKQRSGRVPNDTRVFKIVVVGPNGKLEVYCQREQVHIVRIPTADAFPCLGKRGCIDGARNRCDRKSGGGKQHQIDVQSTLSGQLACVLLHLGQGGLGSQNFLDCRMTKHPRCLPSDQRGRRTLASAASFTASSPPEIGRASCRERG